MKRKLVMQQKPIWPKEANWESQITAQKAGDILILDWFKKEKWKGRHCLNCTSGEYETYDPETGEWTRDKLETMLNERKNWYYCGILPDTHIDSKFKPVIVNTMDLKPTTSSLLREIQWKEDEYSRDKKQRAHYKRVRRIEELMAQVPDLPKELEDGSWLHRLLDPDGYYAFYKKGELTGKTCCSEEAEPYREDGGKKIRHNDILVCPACGKRLTAKTRTDAVWKKCRIHVLQKIDGEKSVARHFTAELQQRGSKITSFMDEQVRLILYRDPAKNCRIYYQIANMNRYEDWWDQNPEGRHITTCYLYDKGISEALEGTKYSDCSRIFERMAADGFLEDYNMIMRWSKDYAGPLEYLYKGRFYRLAKDMVDNISGYNGSYCGKGLDPFGEDIHEIFGLENWQRINRIRDMDGGEKELRWLQEEEESGEKISQETLKWMCAYKISPRDIEFIRDLMRPQQVMNYLIRQKEESYPSLGYKETLEQYADYISMSQAAQKNLADPMVYRPRELKRRHDELIAYRQKAQILKNLDKDPEKAAEYAAQMNQKFPGAEEALTEAREKYTYQSEKYMVMVPETLMDIVREGNALHHCAGSSERYFERLMSRETCICFLRRVDEPQIPYYTIEVEPNGTVRQSRTYLDEETGIEEIRPFLKEWQKHVKKKLKASDLEAQKASAEKREKNLDELRQKGNTRVLKALMEDFMEAV